MEADDDQQGDEIKESMSDDDDDKDSVKVRKPSTGRADRRRGRGAGVWGGGRSVGRGRRLSVVGGAPVRDAFFPRDLDGKTPQARQ